MARSPEQARRDEAARMQTLERAFLVDALAASRAHTYAGQLDGLSFSATPVQPSLSWRGTI